ncbi:sensor histidine kinase [Candidatus Venteria ishoeyi]|uniref:histidine kinase n=1 Tax=Candidatus Venteria ishoeyi TaxID=1899563 RepID=A0A1H6FBM0_9GAMM|nr:ATP-binding protein [Candidatus Venteria ishoeyi]SEH07477.1 Sensor protein ZraS [Candidatus Venteria ishoeyi]
MSELLHPHIAILYIDADTTYCDYFLSHFSDEYRVFTASSIQEALTHIQQQPIRIIISTLNLVSPIFSHLLTNHAAKNIEWIIRHPETVKNTAQLKEIPGYPSFYHHCQLDAHPDTLRAILRHALDRQRLQLENRLLRQNLQQTQCLLQKNKQYKQIEEEIKYLNTELEQRVLKRTVQLEEAREEACASNRELRTVLNTLKLAQDELVQSEKMVILGQLIAGVAHEINTPLAAIRSAIEHIHSFIHKDFIRLPSFFRALSQPQKNDFMILLKQLNNTQKHLSSREKRQKKHQLQQVLQEKNIVQPEKLAKQLLSLGITQYQENLVSILQGIENQEILSWIIQLKTIQKSTTTIHMAAERANKVIFALKTFARHDTNGEKQTCNIIEGIENVLTLYDHQLKSTVEVKRHYQTIPRFMAYPDELNQVWTNLLHNALQAMEFNGILKITVQALKTGIEVCFEDNGCGIPEDVYPHIFEPFFSTKPKGEGTGLGLDIAQKIINKHNGEIHVESQPGKTVFQVVLPFN